MKILFFYQYFGTPKGRWSTRVYELTRRWVLAGYDVTVVTAPYDKSDIEAEKFISKLNIEGIKLIIINSGDSNKLRIAQRVYRAIRFAIVSSWYAISLKHDVCIASSGPITIGIPMILSKFVRKKKTIFEVRDLWPAGGIEMGLITRAWQKSLALWFEKLCYNSSNTVVTASVGQKDHIRKRYNNLNIEVIPNASDIDLFGDYKGDKKLPESFNGKKIFSHLGSLGLIHNTKYWIEVAKKLKKVDCDGDIVLVFIGDGKDREELEEEKLKFNLNNLIFLGSMPKQELPLWVNQSVATLFATLDNEVQDACSPNKIFDSFAAGIPIIQTSRGWIKNLVETEECGINVSLDNPKFAAEKIIELAKNNEEAKRMGNNGYRLAQTIFNREILAQKYLEIINSI